VHAQTINMNPGKKANLWRCIIQMTILAVAIGAGIFGIGKCKRGDEEPAARQSERHEVIRGVEGCLLVVHHHGTDDTSDRKIDELLLAFAAEPGPRKWSWICLAPPDLGDGSSFLSFHDSQVLVAEFRGPWEREAVRAAVEQTVDGYRRGRSARNTRSARGGKPDGSTGIALVRGD